MSQEDKLKELQALKEAGALTDEEFAAAKAKLEAEAAAPASTASAGGTSPADIADKMKEGAAALNQKKDELLASDEFKQAKERAGSAWDAMLNSPPVEKLAGSKAGDFFYGLGPLKSFADGRSPEDPGKAKRIASLVGAYGAAILFCILMVMIMPAPSGGGGGGGGGDVGACEDYCEKNAVTVKLIDGNSVGDDVEDLCEDYCDDHDGDCPGGVRGERGKAVCFVRALSCVQMRSDCY